MIICLIWLIQSFLEEGREIIGDLNIEIIDTKINRRIQAWGQFWCQAPSQFLWRSLDLFQLLGLLLTLSDQTCHCDLFCADKCCSQKGNRSL